MLLTPIKQRNRIVTISCQMMSTYTHDLAVIGGGSGGLAAAKEAARLGAKVVLFDQVVPSHRGTTWGFAGTCVNVGCIPKKLFHYSSLLGESIHDLILAGWKSSVIPGQNHNWSEMVSTVNNFIRKLNFSYRTGARSAGVEYINARARFSNADTDETILEYKLKGEAKQVRAKVVVVAVGSRPTLPASIEGIEHAITSDDIFYSKTAPGKTLVIGGGYIAMECAGFLTGLGYPTTVAVRSKPLRNFDNQMADKIQAIMFEQGTNFLIGKTPVKLTKSGDESINVEFDDGTKDLFNTVLVATGRTPATRELGLSKSVIIENSGKVKVDPHTCLVNNSKAVYAIGDCIADSPELTPVAIKDGELLAQRLFGNKPDAFFDKRFIPTTVFTPSEYGTVGLSEEHAIAKYGADYIECYLYEWPSLERAAFHREKPVERRADEADVEQGNNCFTKLVCLKPSEKVIGFHFLGPNAGEVTQGFALAVKLGAVKADFDSLIGIHPTDAEALCGLSVTKASGQEFVAAGGCGGGKCG
jgi:thioredoxin/glutathione reductase (selenoprotein)